MKGVREDDVFESSGGRILHCSVHGGRMAVAATAKFVVSTSTDDESDYKGRTKHILSKFDSKANRLFCPLCTMNTSSRMNTLWDEKLP